MNKKLLLSPERNRANAQCTTPLRFLDNLFNQLQLGVGELAIVWMANTTRICLTFRGTTIDALGSGQYRICDQNQSCTITQGLWAAYETLRELEHALQRLQ